MKARNTILKTICGMLVSTLYAHGLANIPADDPHIFTLVVQQDTQTNPRVPRLCKQEFIEQIQKGCGRMLTYVPIGSNRVIAAYKGVPYLKQTPTRVTIFARGYSRYRFFGYGGHLPRVAGGVYCGIDRIHARLIHEPCIVLDFPDECDTLNFGQDHDRQHLAHAYALVRKRYPQARITLMGECLGALRMLSFVTHLQELQLDDVVDTIILESPLISVHDAVDMIAQAYLQRYFDHNAPNILHTVFKRTLHAYKAAQDKSITKSYTRISGKTIYLGHRAKDTLGSPQRHAWLAQTLSEKNRVYHFVTNDTTYTHARLYHLPAYRDAMNYFLQRTGLAHNKEHASRGSQLVKPCEEQQYIQLYDAA